MRDTPSEILSIIFDFLSQEDHRECMLVCHLWKDIIEDHSLFRDLRIYSADNLKSFIQKLQRHPAIGRNVEQLTCYFDNSSEVNLTNLLEPLCNLRVFNCFGSEYGNLLIEDSTSFPWRTTIETFTQQYLDPIINHIFATNIFPRLTVLDVCENDDSKLIHFLKNAPALKKLTLRSGNMTFDKMDVLHDSLPDLKTLTLKYKKIFGDTFYKCTAPAKSITEFNLDGMAADNIQQRIDVLRYIRIKYPNLAHLKLDPLFFGDFATEIEQLINQGWRPLLQSLRSQLKELQVCYLRGAQIFIDILDISCCQIQTLYLRSASPHIAFPSIAQSQQALYIKTLVLSRIKPDSFDWLSELKVLESLDIIIERYAAPLCFNFNDIVKHCPDSLLSLYFDNVRWTGEFTNTTHCNVNTLTLAHCYLPPKMDWFISQHFPLLASFTLSNCSFSKRQFNLNTINLHTFCLVQNMNTNGVTVLVQTHHDFEERWYSTRGIQYYYPFIYSHRDYNPKHYPPVISRPASGIEEKPFFTLHCRSMREIFLCR